MSYKVPHQKHTKSPHAAQHKYNVLWPAWNVPDHAAPHARIAHCACVQLAKAYTQGEASIKNGAHLQGQPRLAHAESRDAGPAVESAFKDTPQCHLVLAAPRLRSPSSNLHRWPGTVSDWYALAQSAHQQVVIASLANVIREFSRAFSMKYFRSTSSHILRAFISCSATCKHSALCLCRAGNACTQNRRSQQIGMLWW